MKIDTYWKDPDEELPEIPKGRRSVGVIVLLRDPGDGSAAIDQIIYDQDGFKAMYVGRGKTLWLPESFEVVYWMYALDIVKTFQREYLV